MVTVAFVLFLLTAAPASGAMQAAAATAAAQQPAVLTITAPAEGAEISIDGKVLEGSASLRTLQTPPLATDRVHQYTLVAKWDPNSYTKMTRTKTVRFKGGERVTIDLTVDDPNDRVTVVYVPTPEFVVDEMIKLAAITPQDVTYEPGVGDARITIAAVKAGARRGVGIDLDPNRVTESRTNVGAAGLNNKIEIRLGDALEQPDLSSMTVVFLYMGDHFNMLIRPYLWKQLPVGARVVSHRFKMGDWEPDKTVTLNDEYGLGYEVHLWTITEELKRRK